jgi:uncharacterized protein YbjQ (UPF0145 family)
MRHWIGLCIALAIAGCAPRMQHIPAVNAVVALDFTGYQQRGFLISPYEYSGDYESVGMISILVMPEAKLIRTPTGETDEWGHELTKGEWVVAAVEVDTVIAELYEKAAGMGADAVVDFTVRKVTEEYPVDPARLLTVSGLEVTGFAIKRLGAFE